MLVILLLPIFAHCLPRWGSKPTDGAYSYAHAKSSSIREVHFCVMHTSIELKSITVPVHGILLSFQMW